MSVFTNLGIHLGRLWPPNVFQQLTSLLLCCALTTAHVATFRERQQPELLDLTLFICLEGAGLDTGWDGHPACLAQVGNHQAMKQETKTKTAPQAHVRTPWVRPARPAGGRAAGWAGQGI